MSQREAAAGVCAALAVYFGILAFHADNDRSLLFAITVSAIASGVLAAVIA